MLFDQLVAARNRAVRWSLPALRLPMASVLFNALALVCLFLILVRVVTTFDPYWDTLAYHLPFAARLGGLCDISCFRLPQGLEHRFEGFPRLAHVLQGQILAWTGAPQVLDLLNVAGLGLLVAVLRWLFRVPVAVSFLAFLAVPMVQIHLTASYIDLFVNTLVTAAVVCLARIVICRRVDPRWLGVAVIALAIAANSKFQMLPVAVLILCAIFIAALWAGPVVPGLDRLESRAAAVGVFFLAALLVGATPLINLWRFGNPVYPIDMQLLGIHLAGHEPPVAGGSLSARWQGVPGPLVWLASILEVGAYASRPIPWTVDQGSVAQSETSFRMGGYFGIYVLLNLAFFIYSLRQLAPRPRRFLAGAMLLLSVVTSVLPAAHELRYYMYWMLCLVAFNLMIVFDPALWKDPIYQRLTIYRSYPLVVIITLGAAIAATNGEYLDARRMPRFGDHLAGSEPARTIAQLPPGTSEVCVADDGPGAFLYASVFHSGRTYATRVLQPGDPLPPGCTVVGPRRAGW